MNACIRCVQGCLTVTISSDLLNLFVRPPGDFIYYLLVIGFSVMSLFMALSLTRQAVPETRLSRYGVGLFGVLVAWVTLLGGAVYSTISGQNPLLIVPPIERAINMSVILLVGWAFFTADHIKWTRISNIIVLLLLVLTIVGYVTTGVSWSSSPIGDFNLVWGVPWAGASVAVAVLGVILSLVLWRSVVDSPLKLFFFVAVLIGNIYHITPGVFIGAYPSSTRLGLVIAFAIVPVVLYRQVLLQFDHLVRRHDAVLNTPVAPPRLEAQPRPLPKPASVETQSALLLKMLGIILDKANSRNMAEQMINAMIDILRVDVGVLLQLQDANYADVIYARDRVVGRTTSGIALNLSNQPTLVNVIERMSQRALYVDRNKEELEDFFTRLDIDRIGAVYFQPLVREGVLYAILAVGLPYSERELDEQGLELLKSVGILSAGLIALSNEAREAQILAEDRAIQAMVEGVALSQVPDDAVINARQEMQASLQFAREQIGSLSRQVMQLKIQLDDERTKLLSLLSDTQEGLSVSQALSAITDEQQRLREERDQLMKRLQEAETALNGATASSDEAVVNHLVETLRREQHTLQEERDRLQLQLEQMRSSHLVTADSHALLSKMESERTQLAQESAQLRDKLTTIQAQLRGLGLEEDAGGLAQLTQLYEDRAKLKERVEALTKDKEILLAERARVSDAIQRERERDSQISALKTQVENLAIDRETALKQRDKLRSESDTLQQKLDAVKEHRARLLAQVAGYELELNEAQEEQAKLRLEVQALANSKSDLLTERDKLRADLQVRAQENISKSTSTLKKMVDDLTEERNRLVHELNELRSALATADNQLERAQLRVSVPSLPTYDSQQPELLVSLVQEFRTPIMSIMGYMDLLLGESAGILGDMQRKFLMRVSVGIARLEAMVGDLVKVAQLDTGQYTLDPMPISLVSLIEDSITNATIQFREKSLKVSLDLDDELPLLTADKDALTQVLGQLLGNAYLVSPANSQLTVIAKKQSVQLSKEPVYVPCAVVSIEDRGGGIQPEDVPRVFARKYKADNPLIQGLGDTGVGLSIAKTLVEAHGGILWVETKANLGSIFTFALPISRGTGA